MKTNIAIFFLASILFLFFSAHETFAFRCGSGMVSEGDTKTQVLVTCGKPTSKEKSCENRQFTRTTNRNSRKCGKKLETWHYNCGEGDFIYTLTFENNILTNETTEGRGRGRSNCRGK
jgi:hypothetical protein